MKYYDMQYKLLSNLNRVKEEKEIIVYPFGKVGKQVKKILNDRGIKEAFVVDNCLAATIDGIMTIDRVPDKSKYIWIIATENKALYDELVVDLKGESNESNITIVDLFTPLDYSADKYEVLSRIGRKDFFDTACGEFLYLIEERKGMEPITVAEIGVANGATAVEACKLLSDGDTYYGFDFYDVIEPLIKDLENVDELKCGLEGKGNSRRIFDSFNWLLSDMLIEMRRKGEKGIFDVVYQDGGHDFVNCGLSCCLLKDLVKVGGYIVFDDLHWSMAKSPTYNPTVKPELLEWFTDAQIEECQIQRAVISFMEYDEHFERIFLPNHDNDGRAIYRKVS